MFSAPQRPRIAIPLKSGKPRRKSRLDLAARGLILGRSPPIRDRISAAGGPENRVDARPMWNELCKGSGADAAPWFADGGWIMKGSNCGIGIVFAVVLATGVGIQAAQDPQTSS